MIQSTTGVVLRTQRLTESSLIVRWLTKDWGRCSTVAKGARRAKSAFAGKLDLFVVADLAFTLSRKSDLHTLREVSVAEIHLPLRRDVDRLQVAAYCTALLEQATEADTPLPGLFELFTGLLACLSETDARPRVVYAFELKLLTLLGLFPSLDETGLKPLTRKLATDLSRGEWREIAKLEAKAATVKELNAFMHGFLIYHLGRIPRNRGEALKAAAGMRPPASG